MMKLSELLSNVDIAAFIGDMDLNIEGIAYDSRKVNKNYLFICITGFKTDGHDYIDSAIENGAAAIVTEREVEIRGAATIRVADTRKAMPIIASNFYMHPTKQLKLIGITGTNGKTTTTYLIKSILEADNKRVGLIGTISTKFNNLEIPAARTTAEAFDLQRLFREMVDNNIEYVIMEVSSHALELSRVDNCAFNIGIFTNLTQDHLDFHKTFENYREAKKKLFYKTEEANIVNIDDYHGRIILEDIRKLKTSLITFGIDNDADIKAENVEFDENGIRFILVTPEYELVIYNKTPGKFSVYNCLAAASAAYALGIDRFKIQEGLWNIQTVPGRSEIVKVDKPYTVLLDYAHSPDGLENIIKSVRQYARKRIITLFGCGGDREKSKRPIMGEIAGNLSDFCIITSDNPRSEEPMDIINEVELGMRRTACDYICIENRRDAIKYALTVAREGDIVLVAGKGHETYQELKHGKIAFDEKSIIEELIREEV